MSKEKEYMKIIPKIYKRSFGDLSMFFFVEGIRTIMPTVSIEKALYNYFKYIKEEDFNIESSITEFMRIKKDFYENT